MSNESTPESPNELDLVHIRKIYEEFRNDLAELTILREEIKLVQSERGRYQRMIDLLYDKMVRISQEDESKFDCGMGENDTNIMNPNGEFVYCGKLNRPEADKVWRTMWGLDRI